MAWTVSATATVPVAHSVTTEGILSGKRWETARFGKLFHVKLKIVKRLRFANRIFSPVRYGFPVRQDHIQADKLNRDERETNQKPLELGDCARGMKGSSTLRRKPASQPGKTDKQYGDRECNASRSSRSPNGCPQRNARGRQRVNYQQIENRFGHAIHLMPVWFVIHPVSGSNWRRSPSRSGVWDRRLGAVAAAALPRMSNSDRGRMRWQAGFL